MQTETETETDIDAPEKKVLIKKQLKNELLENMRKTQIHGIPFMVDSKTWYMKVFWIFFFTVFAAFATWLIIKAILDYFEHPVVTVINSNRYGNCFTFNSGFTFNNQEPNEKTPKLRKPIKTVKRADKKFGLNLELYAGISKDSVFSTKKYGSILFIHNQTSKPESTTEILLRPGSHSDKIIKKNFNSLLPSPYSECQILETFQDNKFFKILGAANIAYNQQDCIDLCIQQEIIKKCECYFLEFNKTVLF